MLLSRVERLEARARRAFALKKFPATVKILEQLLEEVGENPHTLAMLALCCHRTHQDERALGYTERALAVDAEHFTALRVRSTVLSAMGRLGEARVVARHGLEVLSREIPADAPRGWRAWLSGRRVLRLSEEEAEWAQWARGLAGRRPEPGEGEGVPAATPGDVR